MKQHYFFAQIVSFVTVLSLPATIALATEPVHHHEPRGTSALQLKDGQKWPTDEALRQGMVNIRNAVTPNLPAIQEDKLDTIRYDRLAGEINAQVAYIVQNCRLEKDADAMLHRVLADIMAGTDAMAGKDKQTSQRAGAIKIVHALEAYGNYFDHPGW